MLERPLLEWLKAKGWLREDTIVSRELPWMGRRVDLAILTRSGRTTAYELKIRDNSYNRSGCGRIYRSRNGDDVTGKAKRASKLRSIAIGGASEGTGASSSCAGEESYWKEASPMSTTRAECGARTCGGIAIS